MVTNGYLLNQKTSNELHKLGVNNYQITIDGDQQIHNKRRPHKTKNDSYQMITKNLHHLLTHSRVSIRSNIDKRNAIFNHSQFLHDIGYPDGHKNLFLYSGKLTSDDPFFRVLNEDTFSKCYLENCQQSLKLNKSKALNLLNLEPKSLFCEACTDSALCFLPDGKIVNCWDDIESEQTIEDCSIGEIFGNEVVINYSRLEHWLTSTSIYQFHDECKQCKLLPICMGGCPKNSLKKKSECCIPKYHLSEFIDLYSSYK